jgi:hypothetical protein
MEPVRARGGRHSDDTLGARRVRVAANIHLGAYDLLEATGVLPEPEWPSEGFEHIVQVAFKDHFIDSVDHPAIRRLRGAV